MKKPLHRCSNYLLVWMSLFCLSIATLGSVQAKTIVVEPRPNQSIVPLRQALRQAQSGDTILVKAGIYLCDEEHRFDDDAAIQIRDQQRLTLKGKPGAYVLSPNKTETLLGIANSSDITIQGLGFGHAIERGYCVGGVCRLENARDILIQDCILHGSGIEAISAYQCNRVSIQDCALAQCTYQTVRARKTNDLLIRNALIVENDISFSDGSVFAFEGCRNLVVENCFIGYNKQEFLSSDNPSEIVWKKNKFAGNVFQVPNRLIKAGNQQISAKAAHFFPAWDLGQEENLLSASQIELARHYTHFLSHLDISEPTQDEEPLTASEKKWLQDLD